VAALGQEFGDLCDFLLCTEMISLASVRIFGFLPSRTWGSAMLIAPSRWILIMAKSTSPARADQQRRRCRMRWNHSLAAE